MKLFCDQLINDSDILVITEGDVILLNLKARVSVRVSARTFFVTLINNPFFFLIKTKYTCNYVYQQKMYTL